MDKDHLWNSFLNNLRIKKKVSLFTYNTIFKDIKIIEYIDSYITLLLPDDKKIIENINKNYKDLIENSLSEIANDSLTIKYIVNNNEYTLNNEKKNNVNEINNENNVETYTYINNLNMQYTFDNFIVGESNKFAYNAAVAVANNIGKLYNPLFIYAKSGLGKTHLLHSIGNQVTLNTDKKVLYVTAENFKNDYRSVANNKNNNIEYINAFREKYRNIDVLIIDDIQFLENATKSQIEFTNTFNYLHDNNKQIIIASDTSITEFKDMEERLLTRFNWGLNITINPPEHELKKNIVKNKIKINNLDLDLSEDVLNYIVDNCGTSVRDLEGTVSRLTFYKIMNTNINKYTLDYAKEALEGYTAKTIYKTRSVDNIINIVAEYYNLTPIMIKGKMKKKEITDARAIAMYLSTLMTEDSLEKIGAAFHRDHATIIYSRNKITNELLNNKKLESEIKILKNKICELN